MDLRLFREAAHCSLLIVPIQRFRLRRDSGFPVSPFPLCLCSAHSAPLPRKFALRCTLDRGSYLLVGRLLARLCLHTKFTYTCTIRLADFAVRRIYTVLLMIILLISVIQIFIKF